MEYEEIVEGILVINIIVDEIFLFNWNFFCLVNNVVFIKCKVFFKFVLLFFILLLVFFIVLCNFDFCVYLLKLNRIVFVIL